MPELLNPVALGDGGRAKRSGQGRAVTRLRFPRRHPVGLLASPPASAGSGAGLTRSTTGARSLSSARRGTGYRFPVALAPRRF